MACRDRCATKMQISILGAGMWGSCARWNFKKITLGWSHHSGVALLVDKELNHQQELKGDIIETEV